MFYNDKDKKIINGTFLYEEGPTRMITIFDSNMHKLINQTKYKTRLSFIKAILALSKLDKNLEYIITTKNYTISKIIKQNNKLLRIEKRPKLNIGGIKNEED